LLPSFRLLSPNPDGHFGLDKRFHRLSAVYRLVFRGRIPRFVIVAAPPFTFPNPDTAVWAVLTSVWPKPPPRKADHMKARPNRDGQ